MTSLPIPVGLPEAAAFLPPTGSPNSRLEDERFLAQAFRSFAEAADSLERSYGKLRSEVTRLNGELEQSNEGLEESLEENRRMRLHLDRILDGSALRSAGGAGGWGDLADQSRSQAAFGILCDDRARQFCFRPRMRLGVVSEIRRCHG